MARIKLRGINVVTKKLADGTHKKYYYHRSTGTALPGKLGDHEFLVAYSEAERTQPQLTSNVASLIRDYLLSLSYARKADSTKREYTRMLRGLEREFGAMPIRALDAPKVRGVFFEYQERIARETPREADNRLTVLSAVFSYAARKGKIARNPLERFERMHRGDRSEYIWTEAPITTFMKGAPVELQRAMILAMHTGQRYGDLIRLRWSDYDGLKISLRQSKGKRRVLVPCTQALKRMLDTTPRAGPYILTRPDGRPWFTERDDKAMGKAWTAHMKVCGLYDVDRSERLEFRDLRGTAVTLLSEAGCPVPQIVSITGHSLLSAHRILEKYLARTEALSQAAIHHFENADATAFANRLQTTIAAHAAPQSKPKGNQ